MAAIAVRLMTMAAALFCESGLTSHSSEEKTVQLLVNNGNYTKACGVVTVFIILAYILNETLELHPSHCSPLLWKIHQ